MAARDYPYRLLVERQHQDTADDGQVVSEWKKYGKFWGGIPGRTGGKSFSHRQQQNEQGFEIVVRNSSETRAITAQMRVTFEDGRVCYVTNVEPLDEKEVKLSLKRRESPG